MVGLSTEQFLYNLWTSELLYSLHYKFVYRLLESFTKNFPALREMLQPPIRIYNSVWILPQ